MPMTNPDPQLVADASAYRALCELAERHVEVVVQQQDAVDDAPAVWRVTIVMPGQEWTYEGETLAKALAAEFEARTAG